MKYLLTILLFTGCIPGYELQIKSISAKVTEIELHERLGVENKIAVSLTGQNGVKYFLIAELEDTSYYIVGNYYNLLVTR